MVFMSLNDSKFGLLMLHNLRGIDDVRAVVVLEVFLRGLCSRALDQHHR